jgi:hypothetical protein
VNALTCFCLNKQALNYADEREPRISDHKQRLSSIRQFVERRILCAQYHTGFGGSNRVSGTLPGSLAESDGPIILCVPDRCWVRHGSLSWSHHSDYIITQDFEHFSQAGRFQDPTILRSPIH